MVRTFCGSRGPHRWPAAVAVFVCHFAAAAFAAESEQVDHAAALDQCNRELSECRSGASTSSARLHGHSTPPPWPEGYGKLLKFPFGMSDMKALKEFARVLWQPDGTAATIHDEVTDRGFARRLNARCTSEMVGVHPVGGPGVRWSAQLWGDAQDWCLSQPECTGIMLYVGKHTLNCHHWCGRPQFCNGEIRGEDGTEPSAEWNLFVRASQPAS
uniref:SCP domain-containing protein n=1 Tax=Alexandrium monilatum TaxID=311494 RepID=A0A7S4Q5A6_9DINO|mmetsp:Transcript_71462/g.213217  ORF Transcript_71462/g.213217 Transcript_71462/m.213217 type:complete len:214 (+) Transcript_71462:97-738(+)